MNRLRASHAVVRFILAWFTLLVVAGSVAPWMHAAADAAAVCSAAGSAPADHGGHDGHSPPLYTIECPLCLPLWGPPTPEIAARAAARRGAALALAGDSRLSAPVRSRRIEAADPLAAERAARTRERLRPGGRRAAAAAGTEAATGLDNAAFPHSIRLA
jgi:hypothetical protein